MSTPSIPEPLIPEITQPSELLISIVNILTAEVLEGYPPNITVTDYQDFVASSSDHHILIKMTGAQAGSLQHDGRIAQQFDCHLFIAVRDNQAEAHLQAMDLASTLAQRVHQNHWGFSQQAVQQPQMIILMEDTVRSDTAPFTGFNVWQVQWQQQLNLSQPLNESDPEITGIWLAVNPEDSDDINQYTQVSDEVA